jgi:hypothetical protein
MITVSLDKSAGFDRVSLQIGGADGWECIITAQEARELAAELADAASQCASVVQPGPK